MSKIAITVSCDVEAKATVVIEVEQSIEGVYTSPKERAKNHVMAALAIGADIPWVFVTEQPRAGMSSYKLDAEVPPDFSESAPVGLRDSEEAA